MRKIAVGILSHNRLIFLKPLVESIRRTRDRDDIDIYVGEDSSPNDRSGCRDWLENQTDICVMLNTPAPLGVAANSNVLLEAMKDYEWKFLLNDDLDIIKHGWTRIYIDMMPKAGLHHCCLDVPMFGRIRVTQVNLNGVDCLKITEKPQGHFLVFDQKAFQTVGYFDEKLFPGYGFEHVDWSNRVSMSGIQPPGIWDIVGARSFILSRGHKTDATKRKQYMANLPNWEKVRDDKNRIYIERDRS
jgi:GT2 family glycosyltransferase